MFKLMALLSVLGIPGIFWGVKSLPKEDVKPIVQKLDIPEGYVMVKKLPLPAPAVVHPNKQDPTALAIKSIDENQVKILELLVSIDRRVVKLESVENKVNVAEVEHSAESQVVENPGTRIVIEPQTGIPVATRTEWIVRQFGNAKVWEVVRKDGKMRPVDVIYQGNQSVPQTPSAPVSNSNASN